MSDLRDFTGKNRRFTGTVGERISKGTTGERDTAFGKGTIRFNTTTNLMEYYEGTDWKAIDAPPVITSFSVDDPSQTNVTSGVVNPDGGGTVQISINGSLFDTTGAIVSLIGSGETLSAVSTTRNSANLLTCTFTESEFDATNDPYTIRVTNGSGLSANLTECITIDNAPVFTNSADTNFNIFDGARGSVSITANQLAGATDAQGDTITFSISSGSLPSGLSINSSTAVISGSTDAVGSDTVSTFTVSAATSTQTSTRQFTITRKAPAVESFTSTGSFTFNVPSGITQVHALVVAGGGSGGTQVGGGGGAGGMVEHTTYPVTPGGSVSGNVGRGGEGWPTPAGVNRYVGQGTGTSPGNHASPGENSTFGNITANGGGAGGNHSGPQPQSGQPGGSGGGGGSSGGQQPGGSATQGNSGGGTGYGNSGGHGHNSWSGGGGGGAGGGGRNSSGGGSGGPGGEGRSSNASGSSVTYAGGGSGCQPSGTRPGPGGPGGGGIGGDASSGGQPGTNNKGGGGGGVRDAGGGAGDGGSGVVIVSY